VVLGGCDTDGTTTPTLRSLQPLTPSMVAEIDRRNMSKESPILIRIFKEEAELEIWKEDRTGRMALLRTYPICRWSGDLGPKLREGDRQAPEGFYTITPALMNPNSNYYLAINMGYPNAYDRSHNRTGAFLMIHGDCSSRGCYAMTDEQMSEIYALARESFFGGQSSFQIHAFPFRMTPQNMARHRSSQHIAFWRMLKLGYDNFEVTRQEPKVDVCDRRYVFNSESDGRFNPTGRCPAMTVPADVMAAVTAKQRRDDAETAALIRGNARLASVRSFADGGMHATFLSAVQPHQVDEEGVTRTKIASSAGTIPANIRLPPAEGQPARIPGRPKTSPMVTGSVPEPVVRVETPVASAPTSSGGGFFGSLFSSSGNAASGVVGRMSRMVGLAKDEPMPNAPKAKPAPKQKAKPADSKKTKQAANPGAIRPKAEEPKQQQTAGTAPAPQASTITGAQPAVPSGSFDNRFGAWR
jgi:murein L,D-transpeptidase YafK